ncbi:unnamed protein product [Phytomonas sp. Hart1]|nr:unnamed protein product [Phytomonas sp. Hart1]|eukprot:CCW70408.1 unnamed protein product [Phytomonas sp. isolate Hart1]
MNEAADCIHRANTAGDLANLVRAGERVAGVDRRCRALADLPERLAAEKRGVDEEDKGKGEGRRRGSLAGVVDCFAPGEVDLTGPLPQEHTTGFEPRTHAAVTFLESLRTTLGGRRRETTDVRISIKQALMAVESLVDVDQLARAVFLLCRVRSELLIYVQPARSAPGHDHPRQSAAEVREELPASSKGKLPSTKASLLSSAPFLAHNADPEWDTLESMTVFYAKKVLHTMRRRLRKDADAAAHLCLMLLQLRIARDEASFEAFSVDIMTSNDRQSTTTEGKNEDESVVEAASRIKGKDKEDGEREYVEDAKEMEIHAALEELQKLSLTRLRRYHAALRCLQPSSTEWNSTKGGLLEEVFGLCVSFFPSEEVSTPEGVGKGHISEESRDAFSELRSRLRRIKPSSIITSCAEFTALPQSSEEKSLPTSSPHIPGAHPPWMRSKGEGYHDLNTNNGNDDMLERSTMEFLVLLVESIVLDSASACMQLSTCIQPKVATMDSMDSKTSEASFPIPAAQSLACHLSLPAFLFSARETPASSPRTVNNSCTALYLAFHAQYLFHILDQYFSHLVSESALEKGRKGSAMPSQEPPRGNVIRPSKAAIFTPLVSSVGEMTEVDVVEPFGARWKGEGGRGFVDLAEVAVAATLREVCPGDNNYYYHNSNNNINGIKERGSLSVARDASEMILQRLSARQKVFGAAAGGGRHHPHFEWQSSVEEGLSSITTIGEGDANATNTNFRKGEDINAVEGRWRPLHGRASQQQVQRSTFVRYLLGTISGGEAEAFVFPSQIFEDAGGKFIEKNPFGGLTMQADHSREGPHRSFTAFWDPVVSFFKRAQEEVLQPFVCAVLNALCNEPLGLVAYHILQYSPGKSRLGAPTVGVMETPVSFFCYEKWETALLDVIREALTRSFNTALYRVSEVQQKWIISIENITGDHTLRDEMRNSLYLSPSSQRFFPYSSLVLSSVLSPTTSSSFIKTPFHSRAAVLEGSAQEMVNSQTCSGDRSVGFCSEWMFHQQSFASSPLGRLLSGASRGREGEPNVKNPAKSARIGCDGHHNNITISSCAFRQDASLGGASDSLSFPPGFTRQGATLTLDARWFAVDSIFTPADFHRGGISRAKDHLTSVHSADEGEMVAKWADFPFYHRSYEEMLSVLVRVIAGMMRLMASFEGSAPFSPSPDNREMGRKETKTIDMAELLGLLFTWMEKTVEKLRSVEAAWSAIVEQEPLPLVMESTEENHGEDEGEAKKNEKTLISESSERARASVYVRYTQRLLKLTEVAGAFLNITEPLATSLYQFYDCRRRPPPPSQDKILLENVNEEGEDSVVWGFAKSFYNLCESVGVLYQRCYHPWQRLLLYEYQTGLRQLYAQDHARLFAIRRLFLPPSEAPTDSSPQMSLGEREISSVLAPSYSSFSLRKLTPAQRKRWFRLEHAHRWLCMGPHCEDRLTTDGHSDPSQDNPLTHSRNGSFALSSTMVSPSFSTTDAHTDFCCFPYQVTDTLMSLVFALQYLLTACRGKGIRSSWVHSFSARGGGWVRGMGDFLEHTGPQGGDRAAWIELFRNLSMILDVRNTIFRQGIVGYLNTTCMVLEENVIFSLKGKTLEDDKKAEVTIPVEEKSAGFVDLISDAMLQLYLDLIFLLRVGECRWHEASSQISLEKRRLIPGTSDGRDEKDIAHAFRQAKGRIDRILQLDIMENMRSDKDGIHWERLSRAIREAAEGLLRRTSLAAGLSPSFLASSSVSLDSLPSIQPPAREVERFNLLGIASEAFFQVSTETRVGGGGASTAFSRRFAAPPNASAIIAKSMSPSHFPTSVLTNHAGFDPANSSSQLSAKPSTSFPPPDHPNVCSGKEERKGEMASPASMLWGSTQRGWNSLWGV